MIIQWSYGSRRELQAFHGAHVAAAFNPFDFTRIEVEPLYIVEVESRATVFEVATRETEFEVESRATVFEVAERETVSEV